MCAVKPENILLKCKTTALAAPVSPVNSGQQPAMVGGASKQQKLAELKLRIVEKQVLKRAAAALAESARTGKPPTSDADVLFKPSHATGVPCAALCDFGCAMVADVEKAPVAYSGRGSVPYAAPEVAFAYNLALEAVRVPITFCSPRLSNLRVCTGQGLWPALCAPP